MGGGSLSSVLSSALGGSGPPLGSGTPGQQRGRGAGPGAGPIGCFRVTLQMQGAEAVPGGPSPRVFQPPHLPQQNPLSYFLHPQPQGRHAQGQPCNLPDLPEMQLP